VRAIARYPIEERTMQKKSALKRSARRPRRTQPTLPKVLPNATSVLATLIEVARVTLADGNLHEWLCGQGLDDETLRVTALRKMLKRLTAQDFLRSTSTAEQIKRTSPSERPRVRCVVPLHKIADDDLDDPYIIGHAEDGELTDEALNEHWNEWERLHPSESDVSVTSAVERFEDFLAWLEQKHGYFELFVLDQMLAPGSDKTKTA
jgi:hypothetical protein